MRTSAQQVPVEQQHKPIIRVPTGIQRIQPLQAVRRHVLREITLLGRNLDLHLLGLA